MMQMLLLMFAISRLTPAISRSPPVITSICQ
jgi:hypothetical protein